MSSKNEPLESADAKSVADNWEGDRYTVKGGDAATAQAIADAYKEGKK